MTNLETIKSETMNNIINTSEIEVGDTFATYAKLVTALGLNSCTGKQRVYQEKEIRRYIDFEKTGKINPKTHKESNEIIVTKIYDEPLEKEKKDKESPFTKPMKSFIYNYYVNKNKRHTIKTSIGIMYDMGIIKSTQDIYTQKDDTTSVKIYKFQLKRLFNRHLEYALSSLERDEKIEYRHTYRLKEHEGQEFYEWSVADRKQTESIKKIEADCRKDYEQTYNRSFNSIKFDNDLFEQYRADCKILVTKMLGFLDYSSVIEIDNGEKSSQIADYCRCKISYDTEKIKSAFISTMRKKIKEYRFSQSDKRAFGKRSSDVNKDIALLDTPQIKELHNRILQDNFEAENPTVDEAESAVLDDVTNIEYSVSYYKKMGMTYEEAREAYSNDIDEYNPFMDIDEKFALLDEFEAKFA